MFKKRIFGLDISDDSIEALVLTKPFFGKAKVTAYARTILKGEVVKNGIVKNPDKLAASITKLLASAKPKAIKTPYCILSLPESQVFTTVFKLPAGLKRKEVKNTIPFKAEEVIPFKASEVYFDFKTLTKIGETQEVFYVAIPSKVVDSYTEVLNSIGLKPVAFDLESISLARALVGNKPQSDKAQLLMDIGSRTTNLNIYDRGGIRQSLTIKIAGDKFTKAVAAKLEVTEAQAEELKRKSGFDTASEQGKVLLILQNEFKRIVSEAKKVIEFYQVSSQRQIEKVTLVGGSALLPKVDQYLADNLGLEVSLGDPLEQVVDPKNLAKMKVNSVLFSNVSGLSLRALDKDPVYRDINLLPTPPTGFKVVPEKSDKKSWTLIYIRLFILVLLALALGLIYKLKLDNVDVLQTVYPTPSYQTDYSLDVDFEVLDEIRALLNASTTATAATSTSTTTATTTDDLIEGTDTPAEPVASEFVKFSVIVKTTTLGYLNVRSGPATSFNKVAEAPSQSKYTVVNEQDDWYEIELADGTTGWVYSIYVDKSN